MASETRGSSLHYGTTELDYARLRDCLLERGPFLGQNGYDVAWNDSPTPEQLVPAQDLPKGYERVDSGQIRTRFSTKNHGSSGPQADFDIIIDPTRQKASVTGNCSLSTADALELEARFAYLSKTTGILFSYAGGIFEKND